MRIRPGLNRVGGKEYLQFTLIYFSGNKRIRQRFADLASAKKKAEPVVTKLANGENEVLKLTAVERVYDAQGSRRRGDDGGAHWKPDDGE